MTRLVRSCAIITAILGSAFGFSCSVRPDLPHFADYLKAERELRRSVQDPAALQDSLTGMAERMSIDLDRTFAWLDGDPGRWHMLIGLLHEKP